MFVLIAQVTGVKEITALISIFGVNASMILFGWIMEMVNDPDRDTWWTPFWSGIAPSTIWSMVQYTAGAGCAYNVWPRADRRSAAVRCFIRVVF